jgi:hypothetical protein
VLNYPCITPWRRVGEIDLRILHLGTSWRWVVSLTSRPLYSSGTPPPPYPVGRGLGGPQSRYGRYGEVKILDPTGLELWPLGHPACSQSLCRPSYRSWHIVEVEIEVEVNLRPTVSRPVCPGVRRPSGTRDQFFFLSEFSFRQLRLCYFVAPSLTRGRVCNLLVQLLLGLARALTLGSKFRRTHVHILLSHLRLPQPGGPGPVFISPWNRVAQLYPWALDMSYCNGC